MQAAELTAEFGIAGILDFVETEHGLVKAAISLDGVAGELYLQGAHLTAWQPPGERSVLFTSPARRKSAVGAAPCGPSLFEHTGFCKLCLSRIPKTAQRSASGVLDHR